METLNLIAAAMTIVLGPLAIWLSLYFYNKAKDSEKETAIALEAIKGQTGALERLTGRWMDRLTKYVTGPRPADESLTLLVTTLAQMPNTVMTQLQQIAGKGQNPTPEALFAELISCYIAIYYYVGVANVIAQASLPHPDVFDPANNQDHALLARILDSTNTDFQFMANILVRVDQAKLNANPYKHLLDEGVNTWRPQVRPAAAALEEKRKQ